MWIASSSSRWRCGDRPERPPGAGIGARIALSGRTATAGADMNSSTFRSGVADLALRGEMDAAFDLVEGAPAAGARVFARLDDRRARRTADRAEALGDQRMRRQLVGGDVARDVGGTPARQRIDLDVRGVALEHRQIEAGRRLEALAPGDPGVEALQGTL